jgi:hypothetical protein
MEMNYDDKMILDPKNDVVFQRIFGTPENEDILISFLNALLEKTEREEIKHVEYIDTKLSDIEAIDDKIGILDVRVVTEKGVMEVVEMGEPAIRKAITVLDMLSRDPETVRLAELRMKKILDEKSMLEGAKEERNKEIAKNALIKGLDISIIVEITGLSKEDVLKLNEEINNH